MTFAGQWKTSKIGVLVLATSAVCSAVVTLVIMVSTARLPYQIDYEEGNVLNSAVRIVHGMPIYPAPHSWPSVINPYGPIGYEMVSWMVRLGGVELELPRLLMIGFTVICCVLIGFIVWREIRSMAAAFAFGALLLSFGVVNSWAVNLRVDMIALAFSLAAIAVLAVRQKWWWVSAVLIVAAIFTKHTSLAAPIACVLWLWLKGERKVALKMTGLAVALGVCGLAYMQWTTHGTFLFYMTGTHPDFFLWRRYFEELYLHFTWNAVISALALVAVVMTAVRRKLSLPVLYLLAATAMTVTIGKGGSSYNHLIELSAAMCIAAGVGWYELTSAKDWKLSIAGTALVLFLAATAVNNALHMKFRTRSNECDEAYTYVKNFRGERVVSVNLSMVVLAGKTLWISNPYVYTQLVKYGGWSDTDFQQQLREHQVDLLMFNEDQEWSPEILKAVQQNYRIDQSFDCREATPNSLSAYVPKANKRSSASSIPSP